MLSHGLFLFSLTSLKHEWLHADKKKCDPTQKNNLQQIHRQVAMMALARLA